MGGTMGALTRTAPSAGGVLRIDLFEPGMTALHRVGLAGLWMTLDVIEHRHPTLHEELRRHGSWTLGPRSVELTWQGGGKAFFWTLIEASFRLTNDGRISLLALGDPTDHGDQGTTLQAALLNTFLQHGKNRKADPSNAPGGAVTVTIDDRQEGFQYRRVSEYQHQKVRFDPTRPGEVVGWLFPGGAVRHSAFTGDTGLSEPPGPWLALVFGAVGAIYFRVQRRVSGVRPSFCIVLPDVMDLRAYASVRESYARESVEELVVSGAADAALRVLIAQAAGQLSDDFESSGCQVVSYGVTQWASQQKTRVDVLEVPAVGGRELRVYAAAKRLLRAVPRPPSRASVTTADAPVGQPTWETSPALDLAARNLAHGQPWWRDFTGLVVDVETWRQMESYRFALRAASGLRAMGGLAAMVDVPGGFDTPEGFDQRGAEIVVRACHTAWRRRMGALAQRATRERLDRNTLVANERERLRVAFAHCKNAATLRATLTDFWSRAGGSIPELQRGWQSVLPYLAEDRWQLARDLALLALVSYAAPPRDAADSDPDNSGDGEL